MDSHVLFTLLFEVVQEESPPSFFTPFVSICRSVHLQVNLSRATVGAL